MANKKTKTEMTSTEKLGIGVGLTAAAVAAAGTYFLYGSKSASKNRKAVKSWALKAKAEVLEKLEEAKEMSKEEYEELINGIASAYVGIKNASKVDINAFKSEMKDHWRAIERTATPKKKDVKKAAKKVVKKAATAKKTVKKVAKAVTKKA